MKYWQLKVHRRAVDKNVRDRTLTVFSVVRKYNLWWLIVTPLRMFLIIMKTHCKVLSLQQHCSDDKVNLLVIFFKVFLSFFLLLVLKNSQCLSHNSTLFIRSCESIFLVLWWTGKKLENAWVWGFAVWQQNFILWSC